jgi:hypothetical protein
MRDASRPHLSRNGFSVSREDGSHFESACANMAALSLIDLMTSEVSRLYLL